MKIKSAVKIAMILGLFFLLPIKLEGFTLTPFFTNTVFAAERTQMLLEYDGEAHYYDSPEITLVINGNSLPTGKLNMPPVIIDDRTYVPVRDVFEEMGAVVDWKEPTSEVFIGYNNKLIILRINDKKIFVDGEEKIADATPRIINNRTMIPVKFASEAMGFTVGWDQKTKIVSLDEEAYVKPVEVSYTEDTAYLDDDEEVIDISLNNDIAPAVDVSATDIPEIPYPQTKIVDIKLPSVTTANEFRIIASSEISKVKKTLLEDNRLVIDVYNALADLPKSNFTVADNIFLSTIRTGQNEINSESVARVVFDLTASVNYSVSISADRKEIIVKFESNTIRDVSFYSDGTDDFITITADTPPGVSVFTLTNPNRIVIDIPLGIISEENIETGGIFVSALRTAQFEKNTARIVADLNHVSAFKVSSSGNTSTVQISKPTYKNITYDLSSSQIIIPKTVGNTIDVYSILHTDDYSRERYILTLGGDYSDFLGYGEYYISDSGIKSVTIQTIGGMTQLVINENKILAFDVYEDDAAVYIKPVSPKEKYSKIVIIDPGHGGKFTGTTGNGLLEKELNLSISRKVVSMLENDSRVKVYATRLDDKHLHEDLSTELLMRSAIANTTGNLFVSIHNNAFSEKSNGTETYYNKKNDNLVGGLSKAMADLAQKNLLEALGSFDRKVQDEDFSVLRNTKIPAILIEVGFVSNPEEAAKLATDEYQTKAAIAIYNSIIEFFELHS